MVSIIAKTGFGFRTNTIPTDAQFGWLVLSVAVSVILLRELFVTFWRKIAS